MKQSKAADPNQLILKLTIDDPSPAMLRQAAVLLEIAGGVVEIPRSADPGAKQAAGYAFNLSDTAVVGVAAAKVSMESQRDDPAWADRAWVRRLVGNIVLTHGRSWEEVWIMAYARFQLRTKVCPAAVAAKEGRKIILDVIFDLPDGPDVLREILAEMLVDYHSPFK